MDVYIDITAHITRAKIEIHIYSDLSFYISILQEENSNN